MDQAPALSFKVHSRLPLRTLRLPFGGHSIGHIAKHNDAPQRALQ
jgi:hypothetical protein